MVVFLLASRVRRAWKEIKKAPRKNSGELNGAFKNALLKTQFADYLLIRVCFDESTLPVRLSLMTS